MVASILAILDKSDGKRYVIQIVNESHQIEGVALGHCNDLEKKLC